MRTTDFQELLDTVERLRKEKYPSLDDGFLQSIVRIEEENPEDDAEALRAIDDALRAVLSTKVTS